MYNVQQPLTIQSLTKYNCTLHLSVRLSLQSRAHTCDNKTWQ